MFKIFLIIYFMIFMHIVDDYYLQGWLASAKQKKWWETNAPESLYRNDYKVALIMHGFSWSFMISIPLIIMGALTGSKIIFVSVAWFILPNALLHAWVDHLKANKRVISLVTDQTYHILQILVTSGVIFSL